MGELALAMATVIVERSSLLPALLPGPPHPAATGAATQVRICFPRDLFKFSKIFVQAATYAALLAAFYHYMQLVRQQDARCRLLLPPLPLPRPLHHLLLHLRVAWSESQDLINVVWGSGECATLHILVVHAQVGICLHLDLF